MQNGRILEELKHIYALRRSDAEYRESLAGEKLVNENPVLMDAERNTVSLGLKRISQALETEASEFDSDFKSSYEKRSGLRDRVKNKSAESGRVYICETCRDRGVVDGNPCPACYASVLKEAMSALGVPSSVPPFYFSDFDLSIFDDVPEFGKISAAGLIKSYRDNLLSFLKNFEKMRKRDKSGFIFSGRTGTGKTFLAACAANFIQNQGYLVQFMSAPELMRRIEYYEIQNKSFRPDTDKLDFAKLRRDLIFDSDLLVVDDFGTETTGVQAAGTWLEILNSRLEKNNPIIFTTNMGIRQIERTYEDRIFSRLMAGFNFFDFKGKDLRSPL